MRTRLGLVILEVPIRRYHCLPDTVQIGVAIGRARRAIRGWKLRARRRTLLSEEWGNGQRDKDNDERQAEAYDRAPKLHPGPPRFPCG
jgi:hypothetical protein